MQTKTQHRTKEDWQNIQELMREEETGGEQSLR